MCREVFTPFSIKLRNMKPMLRVPGDAPPATERGSRFGEMTQVLVPFINVTMDSKEFSILMDIIMNIGVAEVWLSPVRPVCVTPSWLLRHLPTPVPCFVHSRKQGSHHLGGALLSLDVRQHD